jgi:chitinase
MMKKACVSAFVLCMLACPSFGAPAEPWIAAYYPGWRQSRLPPAAIDFEAFTHLVQFSVVPRADGTLDAAVNMLTAANVAAAVAAAHAAGKKILFTVGGQGSGEAFAGAIAPAHRSAFVSALDAFRRDHGYDGIDVDYEILTARDAGDYAEFIRELRRKLAETTPRPLLTAAALWQPALFARLAGELDQINLMTYNLSGAYPGWVVWHNGALFSGGHRFPNGKGDLPSVDGLATAFLNAGVPREKLGVGLSFNGSVWTGGEVSRPLERWSAPPTVRNATYFDIARTYGFQEGLENPLRRWDESAQAAYLSVPASSAAGAQFVSYADEATIRRMMRFVRTKGIGGLVLWDLGAGYRIEQPPGRRDPLLQAVKSTRREGR